MNTKRILILTTSASLAAVLAYGVFSSPPVPFTPSQAAAVPSSTPVPETTAAGTTNTVQVTEPTIQYVDLPAPTAPIQIARYDRDRDEEKNDGHKPEESRD